jgi:TolB-like protein
MPANADNPLSFFQELKRRKVIRVIIVYAAASFVILELISIIEEPFGLADWTLRFVFVVLCIGLVISIILSWIYEITPEGIEKTKTVREISKEDKPVTSRSWKIASYISFVVIVGLIILNVNPRRRGIEKSVILEKSIAVIPFIDDSPDKDNEHIINGIIEDLLINLQAIQDLRVPGRTSVAQYRNNPKPIPEIAAAMNVAYIVEGSGQHYGNKIRLRVQLVEGETDKHIWADSYGEVINGPEDIFRIQSQIAKSIADELQAVITSEQKQLIEKVPTTSLTAYDFYQRGREEHLKYWLNNNNKDALERAEDFYYKALEYDSTFAQSYIGLAWVFFHKRYWETLLAENFLDSMLILAETALSFDNQLSEAYLVKGNY